MQSQLNIMFVRLNDAAGVIMAEKLQKVNKEYRKVNNKSWICRYVENNVE